jgi:hypothetical protein
MDGIRSVGQQVNKVEQRDKQYTESASVLFSEMLSNQEGIEHSIALDFDRIVPLLTQLISMLSNSAENGSNGSNGSGIVNTDGTSEFEANLVINSREASRLNSSPIAAQIGSGFQSQLVDDRYNASRDSSFGSPVATAISHGFQSLLAK